MAQDALTSEFDQEMLRIYQRALSEAHYKATRFLTMLHEHRGLETARLLNHSPTASEGYTALWERKRLDLTVEAVIHDNPKWHPPAVQPRRVSYLREATHRLWLLLLICRFWYTS
jgi:hypothetical protein